jgi:hypothetical protein
MADIAQHDSHSKHVYMKVSHSQWTQTSNFPLAMVKSETAVIFPVACVIDIQENQLQNSMLNPHTTDQKTWLAALIFITDASYCTKIIIETACYYVIWNPTTRKHKH